MNDPNRNMQSMRQVNVLQFQSEFDSFSFFDNENGEYSVTM